MGWVNPTGGSGLGWTNISNTYDDNTGTSASYTVLPASWSQYITLTRDSISCSKVEVYSSRSNAQITQIEVDVYDGDGATWDNIYSGSLTIDTFVEYSIGATYNTTQMRMRYYNAHATKSYSAYVMEADFWEEVSATPISVTDASSAGSDSIAGKAKLTLSDTGSGMETILMAASMLISDLGSGLDAATIYAILSLVEGGSGSDLVSVVEGGGVTQIAVSDAGYGSDGLGSMLGKLTLQDTGSGADLLAQLIAYISTQDVGSGNDVIASVVAKLLLADSGIGSDTAGPVHVSVTVTTTGSGSDAIKPRVSLTLSDVGSGLDAVSHLVKYLIMVSDVGVGIEEIAIEMETFVPNTTTMKASCTLRRPMLGKISAMRSMKAAIDKRRTMVGGIVVKGGG